MSELANTRKGRRDDGIVSQEKGPFGTPVGLGSDAPTYLVIPASHEPAGLAEFRLRHVHHPGAVIPFHTTLFAPFLSLREFELEGLARLRELAARTAPFEYHSASICTFPTSNALWLAPSPVTPFEALTLAVHDCFPHLPRGVGYPTFHMTIGLTASPDEIPPIVQEFQAVFGDRLPFHFTCRELAVYVGEDDAFVMYAVLPLGANAQPPARMD